MTDSRDLTETATARALGYRMPAEFEPIEAVWVTPPHNAETWPGCLENAQRQHAAFCEAIARYATVRRTSDESIPTNDSWIRDFGPIFVTKGRGEKKAATSHITHHTSHIPNHQSSIINHQSPLACHDFTFNGWGGKYEVRDLDDAVPQHVARMLDIPLWQHELVLEGGSIDVNGRGTVMTTEQCLLNPNRNPGKGRDEIERELHEALGTTHAIWLPGGIVGDDTDGHIDDIARFVSADTVVTVHAQPGHPDHDMLERNRQALMAARDQAGARLNVIDLPMPQPIIYDFPPDRFGPGGKNPVPASYANFLIVNAGVIVPVFGQDTDDAALHTLEQALPGRTIEPVRAEHLVVGLGAVHCLTMQQPGGFLIDD